MGKRYATKRRLGAAKRHTTKRRRGTKRRATRPRKSFRRKLISGGAGEIKKVTELKQNRKYKRITTNLTIKNDDQNRYNNIGLLTKLLNSGYYIVATGCDDDECETPNFQVITDSDKIEYYFNKKEDGSYAYTDFTSYIIENIDYRDAYECVSDPDCEFRGSKVYNDDDSIQYRRETYL